MKRISLRCREGKDPTCDCALLLSDPELLILDEPTNHLDFKTLMWLEDYLNGYRGAVLIVSHDRYFLDKLAKKIWSLTRGSYRIYRKLHAV